MIALCTVCTRSTELVLHDILYILHRLFAHQDDADIDAPLPESSSGQTLGESGAVEGGQAEQATQTAAPKSIKCEEYVLMLQYSRKNVSLFIAYSDIQLWEVVQEWARCSGKFVSISWHNYFFKWHASPLKYTSPVTGRLSPFSA